MAGKERQLQVSVERCIGCRACVTVCPAGLIALADSNHRRTVRFAAVCAEDCDLCVTACPTQAIRLAPLTGKPEEEATLDFVLDACAECGAVLAPLETLVHLRATIPPQVQADAEGGEWLVLCPVCRQREEARRMGREVLLTRWMT